MTDLSQVNTDRTYPGRWTISFSNPPINMFVPTTIVELGALMTNLEADPSVKVVVFQSANPDFFHRPSRRIQGSWTARGAGPLAQRPIPQPRDRRRTGPGRRSVGMAPALGRPLAGT